jgi:hypothetical protein
MTTLTVYKFQQNQYVCLKSDFPWRRGIIFTTESLLQLQNELLIEQNYKSVFLGHFTQNGVENLFSMMRSKIPDPTPSQAVTCIKKIALGRYMEEVPRSSYEFTNGMFLLDPMVGYDNHVPKTSYALEILPLSPSHDKGLLTYIYGACVFAMIRVQLNSCTCKSTLM